MMRTTGSLRVVLQALTLWLMVLAVGCGGGGSTIVSPPDPTDRPDPNTSGGQPGPNPDQPGSGGQLPPTGSNVRSGVTDGNGEVRLPAFASAAGNSKAGKEILYRVADANGAPIPGVSILNVQQGGEFLGVIQPATPNRAPRFFFSQRIPDRLVQGDSGDDDPEREGTASPSEFGPPVSSALNIAIENNTLIVRLNLEEDAAISSNSGVSAEMRHFRDDDLLNRVLSFGAFTSLRGVFNQAELGNAVADALSNGGGYFYYAAHLEGTKLTNWQLAGEVVTNPNDPTFRRFLDNLLGGGELTATYFVQQVAAGGSADKAAILSQFNETFGTNPITTNLRAGQRYLLVQVTPEIEGAGDLANNRNLLIAVPLAPRALSLEGADGTPNFALNTPKGLRTVADYAAGSSITLAPNPTQTEGLSSRIALTMTPFRPGDDLARPGFPATLTAVDELQRNIRADYFIPDYFGDPASYPQNQLGTGCGVCIPSNVLSVIGPGGVITNLLPTAKLALFEPQGGSGRMSNNQLVAVVSAQGSSDPDSELVRLEIDWGDGTPNSVREATDSVPLDLTSTFAHAYTQAGTFTIRATVTDNGDPVGQASATVPITVIANANPVICLVTNPETIGGEIRGEAPLQVNFNFECSTDADSSLTTNGKISIDFGDNVRITNESFNNFKNVNKTYINPGTYLVQATVTDVDGGTDSLSVTVIAEPKAQNQPPIAVIDAEPTSGQAPLTVNFSSAQSSDPDGFIQATIWNFGDPAVANGGVSTLANPSHTYTQPDQIGEGFTASLTVIDNSGVGAPNDRNTATIVINVSAPTNTAPTVVITGPEVAEVGQQVQFFSTGSFDPEEDNLVSWFWDFGDGNTSTEQNPFHTYETPSEEGVYFVSCQITDDGTPPQTGFGDFAIQIVGDFDSTSPWAIIVPQSSTVVTPGATINFDASASYSPVGSPIVSYDWLFTNDGSTDTGATVSQTFPDLGSYSVILTVRDEENRPGAIAIQVIVVELPPFGPGAQAYVRATCAPLEFETGQPVQFSSVGTYDPENVDIVIVGWDFGDGNTTTEANPMHTFTTPGLKLVKLTANDSDGGSLPDPRREVTGTLLVRVIDGGPGINIPPVGLPIAEPFLVEEAPGSVSLQVLYPFDVDGELVEESFVWSIPDLGETQIGQRVDLDFPVAGLFEVFLTITDALGAETETNLLVNIGPFESQFPVCSITIPDETLIRFVGQEFTLDLTGSQDPFGEALTFSTDFGDGSDPVDGDQPVHTYTTAGKYTVSVTVENESGFPVTRLFTVLVANPG